MEKQETPIDIRTVELGDVIRINAPRNIQIDQNTYYIFYVDETTLKMVNTATNVLFSLNIDKVVAEESIETIDLLSRSKVKGYARQHKLVPPAWINVHFGGEDPEIIKGEITNLEEDMIEITTAEREHYYIDFAYQGIPQNLPITKIVIRDRPSYLRTSLRDAEDFGMPTTREELEETETSEESEKEISENAQRNPTLNEQIDEYLYRDSNTEFEPLEDFVVYHAVLDSQMLYSEEMQLADLTGRLISDIPAKNRTEKAIREVQRLVTRFRELRRSFSIFDANGNVRMAKVTDKLHKPLIDQLMNMDTPVKWAIPVVYENTKLFQTDNDNSTFIQQFTDELKKIQKSMKENIHPEIGLYNRMLSTIDTGLSTADTPNLETTQGIYLHQVPIKKDYEVFIGNNDLIESESVKISGTGKRAASTINTVRYSTRRYSPGGSRMALDPNIRTRIYRRISGGEPERANVKSIVFLPRSVWMQSSTDSPSANLYMKSKLSEVPVYKFKFLTPKTNIRTRIVDDMTAELDYDTIIDRNIDSDRPLRQRRNPNQTEDEFLSHVVNYLPKTYIEDPDMFRQFLHCIVPRTRTLVRWMRPSVEHLYSFADIATALEPFLVDSDSITFQQYKDIRFYIKDKMRNYIASMAKNRYGYNAMIDFGKANNAPVPNPTNELVTKTAEYAEHIVSSYRLKKELFEKLSASESLNYFLESDHGYVYNYTFLDMNLRENESNPDKSKWREEAVKLLYPEITSEATDKIKTECDKKFIAKRYKTIAALNADNDRADVVYDKEYDDTPYELLNRYKDDRARMKNEDTFREFFRETLIQKHDCPNYLADKMADTIISKRKLVTDGEYAILEIKPTLKGQRRDENEDRAKILEDSTVEYYRRENNVWKLDRSVSHDMFVDSNTLFCELSEHCNKLTQSNQCVPEGIAAMQMRVMRRSKILAEFEQRIAKNMKQFNREMSEISTEHFQHIIKYLTIKRVRQEKQSRYSYELGKFAAKNDIVESPYVDLREKILGWPDFVAKQSMITRFVDKYCREPNFMEEDTHWLYCKDTNTKLFPYSLYELAYAFHQNEYTIRLDDLKRRVGVNSDDGDAIVDKYTGYVLQKNDFSAEEGFDEEGFKITTNAVIEETPDISKILENAATSAVSGRRVFKNAMVQSVYNVFHILSQHMGITADATDVNIEELVMKITTDILSDSNIIKTKQEYEREATERMKANTGKVITIPPYETYYNQILILTSGCVTLIGLQTMIPPFRPKKTFYGCIKSFAGYPLDPNPENVSGIKYIACILDNSKSSVSQPWISIKNLSINTMIKRMKEVLQSHLTSRPDVQKLYETKRTYTMNNPETDIAEEIAIQRWVTCLPPVVRFTLDSPAVGITEAYEAELMNALLQGSRGQFDMLNVLKGKIIKHGYSVYDTIARVVKQKNLLLSSKSGIVFLENACCNNKTDAQTALAYFVSEQKDLEQIIRRTTRMDTILKQVKNITKARTFYDASSSRLIVHPIPDNIVSSVIYSAFIHYCNYDTNAPVPSYLVPYFGSEKPEYDRYTSLTDKIEYMRNHGKDYGISNYYTLMRIINQRNIVQHPRLAENTSAVDGLQGMIDHYSAINSHIVNETLRARIIDTLATYQDHSALQEDPESNQRLMKYLQLLNSEIHAKIVEYLDIYGQLSTTKLTQISQYLENLEVWKNPDITTAIQSLRNIAYNLSKVYPNMILSKKAAVEIPKHWPYSPEHQYRLGGLVEEFYKDIQQFSEDIGNKPADQLPIFSKIVKDTARNLNDIVLFIEHIPTLTPIVAENGNKYYPFYSEKLVLEMCKCCILSVVFEYIVNATNKDNEELRAREIQANLNDESGIVEMELISGDMNGLRVQVAKMLSVLLDREMKAKLVIDKNYQDIMYATSMQKLKDKADLTDYLGKLTREERKHEQFLRAHKIGERWNRQASVYKYDEKTYINELKQFGVLANFVSADAEGERGGITTAEMDAEDVRQQARDYDNGDGGIETLDEEYGYDDEEGYDEDGY